MSRLGICSVVAFGFVLSACSEPVEMAVITPEPTYNKLGEGECPEGYTYIPGALFEGECDPDDDPRRPPDDDDRPPDDDDRPGSSTIPTGPGTFTATPTGSAPST